MGYSIYLLHGFAISLIGSRLIELSWYQDLCARLQRAVFFAAVALLTVAAATVMYNLVETP